MDDAELQNRIEQLEADERALRADEGKRAGHSDDPALAADAEKLAEVRVELDRLWDLLRQRRARRAAGQDPDGAQIRDADTVEGYLG
jgi:hypothetical protein